MLELLTSVLQEHGDQTMLKTHQALLAIWVNLSKVTDIAPEVMCRQNHGIAVDYFAVGVMAFECMFGRVRKFF